MWKYKLVMKQSIPVEYQEYQEYHIPYQVRLDWQMGWAAPPNRPEIPHVGRAPCVESGVDGQRRAMGNVMASSAANQAAHDTPGTAAI